ncbi:MAG: hypothetical protein U5P10_11940 [Spirochaetia bacterium]|nr:hypothetical protein [Spirochaetia bacterium]
MHLFAGRHKTVLKVYTDDHQAYPRAFRRHKAFAQPAVRQGCIIHDAAKGTKQPGRVNKLFAVNYMDRQFRKDTVNYALHGEYEPEMQATFWSGCVCIGSTIIASSPTGRTARDGKWHWNLAGVNGNLVAPMLESRFVWRPFVTFLDLTPGERGLWFRLYRTPLKKGREYLPKYAYS